MSWITDLSACWRRFLSDDRGVAAIEFLTTSPLLFGAMVFTAEYGQAMRVRAALDGAVQDATRYLSRVAVDNAQDGFGNPSITFYQQHLDEARALIEARTGRQVINVNAEAPDFAVDVNTVDVANFRTDYYVITVKATVFMDLPLLNVINMGRSSDNPRVATSFTMTAADIARWVGEAPPGLAACNILDRAQQTCPSS